ncbi:hypothetical protein CI610_00923 [invertebrate metagenome]|uniref:General secretion pathway GspH domain-containing protein n=1 Tax=invertebrate metagenome TaxID=1711999 RepID=A0A2H9TA55_9ZZZZ
MIYRTRQYGLTFVELLFVAIVSAVVVFSGVIGLKGWVTGWQLDSLTQQLRSSLDMARNRAVFHRTSVSVCASDGNKCADSQMDWSSGWMVFSDTNNNGDLDDSERLIKIFSSLTENVSVRWNRKHLRFNSLGQTADAGSFVVCHYDRDSNSGKENEGRKVVVSLAGRIRTEDIPFCN